MIVLFTDFGLHGPYTGQMKAVLHQTVPGVPVIDLFADAPAGNPKAAAYLLTAYDDLFPAGTVFLCVVDPGVGSERPPIILKADGRWYVGPGNGLFELVHRRAEEKHSWDIEWNPAQLPSGARLAAAGRVLERARTFSDLPPGDAFWYENSNGLAEIAVNQGRADRTLGLAIGSPVEVLSWPPSHKQGPRSR
jgi:S-adenosylmethionine hydrolase